MKPGRDGAFFLIITALVGIISDRAFHLSAEEQALVGTVLMGLASFGYRIVRRRWPWLMEADPPTSHS